MNDNKNTLIIISVVLVAVCAVAATTLYFVKSFTPTATVASVATNASIAPLSISNLTNQSQVVSNTTATEVAGSAMEMAQIIFVQPHMITVSKPYTVCHKERRSVNVKGESAPPIAGTVIGGVAGGIIGNQVGGGTGKTIATVAGALGGAMVGSSIESNMNKPQTKTYFVKVCVQKIKSVRQQSGYEVTYIYKGVQGVKILKNKPSGETIPMTILQTAPSL